MTTLPAHLTGLPADLTVEALERATARAMSERELWERHVKPLARLLGFEVYHTFRSDHSPAGWPDAVICKPPRLMVVEFKRVGRSPTAAQVRWLSRLAACGVETAVWRPTDWVSGEIERVLRGGDA